MIKTKKIEFVNALKEVKCHYKEFNFSAMVFRADIIEVRRRK